MEKGTAPQSHSAAVFGAALREWRRHRGLSQLDLALRVPVSPRHVSFLETGRASPSRSMVLRLLDALDVPLRERNRALLAAGFAPAYSETALRDDQMAHVRRAVRMLLERQDPYPAFALDGAWNVIDANRTHARLVSTLLPAAGDEASNLLRLLCAPHLLRPYVLNWHACTRILLHQVRHRLDAPRPPEGLAEVVAEIRGYPDVPSLLEGGFESTEAQLVIPVALRVGDHTLRWITTLITFAGAVDITLAELTVECFFPADEETARLARAFAAGLP
jgi:transcriptional regulator with XRE-family HTH domain